MHMTPDSKDFPVVLDNNIALERIYFLAFWRSDKNPPQCLSRALTSTDREEMDGSLHQPYCLVFNVLNICRYPHVFGLLVIVDQIRKEQDFVSFVDKVSNRR